MEVAMAEAFLGHFGDNRLKKGARFCWAGSWSRAVAGYVFGGLGAIGLVKFGSRDFCVIPV
jgi:hypothetical protein